MANKALQRTANPLLPVSALGRNSPLGGHGWISSPERRETATIGRSAYVKFQF